MTMMAYKITTKTIDPVMALRFMAQFDREVRVGYLNAEMSTARLGHYVDLLGGMYGPGLPEWLNDLSARSYTPETKLVFFAHLDRGDTPKEAMEAVGIEMETASEWIRRGVAIARLPSEWNLTKLSRQERLDAMRLSLRERLGGTAEDRIASLTSIEPDPVPDAAPVPHVELDMDRSEIPAAPASPAPLHTAVEAATATAVHDVVAPESSASTVDSPVVMIGNGTKVLAEVRADQRDRQFAVSIGIILKILRGVTDGDLVVECVETDIASVIEGIHGSGEGSTILLTGGCRIVIGS